MKYGYYKRLELQADDNFRNSISIQSYNVFNMYENFMKRKTIDKTELETLNILFEMFDEMKEEVKNKKVLDK